MHSNIFLLLTVWCILLISCKEEPSTIGEYSLLLRELECYSESGGCSNLFVDDSGKVFLSWIEYLSDTTDALMFCSLENDKWSRPQKIAEGSDWFVNWADFPAMVSFPGKDEQMAVHWLQKSNEGVYDYDIMVSLSGKKALTWAPPFILHRDSIAAEHGFVSLISAGQDRIFATWLDGRFTKKEDGAMTLRAAEFDANGQLYAERELDHRVCDCCQTDAALTPGGPVVVYRDRSETEVRDIFIVREVNGEWTSPKPVFADNWTIAGCPVNGPAVASHETSVVVAWFTAPENQPEIKVAFSGNNGADFAEPLRIDKGNPLGRVDVVWLDPDHALVSWLEKTANGAEIRVQKITKEGPVGESIALMETTHSRESGFPILVRSDERIFLSWTAVDSTGTRVKTAEILH